MNERVFTDRDFDNRMQPKAKPGEIWSAVQNLQDMFESAKKDGDRRMKENLVSFNNRRIDSFKETGLKNVSDAELKAEYRRRFGESAKKNKKAALKESLSDSDLDDVNMFLDEFGHTFYFRTSPAGLLAVALKGGTGYDDKESAKEDIEGFLEEHGDEFDLSFSSVEFVNDNDDEWVFALDGDTDSTGDSGHYNAALKFVKSNWNDFFNGDTEFEDSLGDVDVRVEIEGGWISIIKLSMADDDELFSGDEEEFKALGPEGVAKRVAADL